LNNSIVLQPIRGRILPIKLMQS